MRPVRSSWVVTLTTLASAASAAAIAAFCSPVLWKLSEQCLFYDDHDGFVETCRRCGDLSGPLCHAARGLMQVAHFSWGAAVLMSVLAGAASASLALAFPRLRGVKLGWTLLLPATWLAATMFLPVLPVWLIPAPEFPAFVPLLVIAATILATGVRRWWGAKRAAAAFAVVVAAVGGARVLSPFVGGEAGIPRLRLVDEVPALAAEAAAEAGDFAGLLRRPLSGGGRRMEIAYRVLAHVRLGRPDEAKTVPGANDYVTCGTPQALMDGYKLLYHYGLVLPARRLAMELAAECPSEGHAVHDLYLGDSAYVTGEFGLAERHYRRLARSPLHRAKAKSRLASMRAGKSAAEVGELRGVAELYAAWKDLAATSGQPFYSHGQNLEAFVYDGLAKLGGRSALAGAYTNIYYGVRVRRFDCATRSLSAPERVIDGNASRMSCALPRVSPDGRWMVLTVSPFGVFPIWHKVADLWLLDLQAFKTRPLAELNSPETESWHEFSSDGRWMVFSSRRGDGTFTRPWIARFDAAEGRFDRPFPLPLRDPDDDFRRMQSYNLPAFVK